MLVSVHQMKDVPGCDVMQILSIAAVLIQNHKALCSVDPDLRWPKHNSQSIYILRLVRQQQIDVLQNRK